MKRSLGALAAACALILAGCVGHHATTQKLHAGPAACPGYVTAYGCAAHSPTFGLPPTGPPKLTAPSSTPTAAMFDSVTVSVLPHGAAAYAGYLFGNFPTFRPIVAAFLGAAHVPIVIHASEIVRGFRMVCIDVEPGDEWPVTSAVGAWGRAELAAGVKPCAYSALKNGMAQTEQALAGSGLHRSQYFLWDADWTGSPHLDSGFDATQWTDHYLNRNVDASQATRAFLGIAGPPPVPDLGGAQHYERYPTAPRRPNRERQSVQGWDNHACMNPARRPVCRVTRSHLAFDLGRDQTLYARDSKQARDELRLPGRIQGVVHRLDGRGIVKRWL